MTLAFILNSLDSNEMNWNLLIYSQWKIVWMNELKRKQYPPEAPSTKRFKAKWIPKLVVREKNRKKCFKLDACTIVPFFKLPFSAFIFAIHITNSKYSCTHNLTQPHTHTYSHTHTLTHTDTQQKTRKQAKNLK